MKTKKCKHEWEFRVLTPKDNDKYGIAVSRDCPVGHYCVKCELSKYNLDTIINNKLHNKYIVIPFKNLLKRFKDAAYAFKYGNAL